MPSRMLYRLSGIALLLGTLLIVLFTMIGFIFFGAIQLSYLPATNSLTMLPLRIVEIVTGPLWLAVNLAILVGSMLLVAGLPGMYSYLAKRVGWLGLIGYVLITVALLLIWIINRAVLTFILPFIVPHAPRILQVVQPSLDLGGVSSVASLLFSLGAFLLGLAILRTAGLPNRAKVTSVALLLAAVCNVLHLEPLLGSIRWFVTLGSLVGILSFLIGLAMFGSILVSLTGAQVVRPSQIPTDEGFSMSAVLLQRLSGLALLVGSVLASFLGLYRLSVHLTLNVVTSSYWVPMHLIALTAAMLILLGLPGMIVRLVSPTNWLGIVGFALTFCAVLLLGVIDSGFYAFGIPLIATFAPHVFDSLFVLYNTPLPLAVNAFYFIANLVFGVGSILFGRAIIRAAILPHEFDVIGQGLIFAGPVGAIGGILNFVPTLFVPTLNGSFWMYALSASALSFMAFVLAMGVCGGALMARTEKATPVIGRPLIYGVLTGGVVIGYVLVVGSFSVLLQLTSSTLMISLVAIGLVAILFQPLRDHLQRAVNRLVYGERDNPYAVLSRLGQHMEATLVPEAVLPTIVETVAQTLKLPYAAITFKQQDEEIIVASYGSAKEELIRFPLIYQSERIGALLLASRSAGEPLTPADRRLLNDLARQVGSAAYSVRVTMDLQHLTTELLHSRTQLVTAREEERRRLRRDLHDGLGSVLAALNWRAGAIRLALAHDPTAADTLVVEQQSTIRAAIADIRRLVYELRPPALDELGLVGAIRERAAQYSRYHALSGEREEPGELRVEVGAPDTLLTLPAAIEVVVYRIVQEALANVVRHAHAQTCGIRLTLEQEQLLLEVTDDGVGLGEAHHVGVGLLSMRERAEELGGTCDISSAIKGGTCVRVCLPLPKE